MKLNTLFIMGVLSGLVLTGCGGARLEGPEVFPVSGSVFANDNPAFDALITLHPINKEQNIRPSGQVDDEGHFVLTSRKPGDGAPVGEYKVSIQWPEAPVAMHNAGQGATITSMAGNEGELKTPPRDRLGGAYADPETSGLKCTITEGENQLPAFKLNLNKVRTVSQGHGE